MKIDQVVLRQLMLPLTKPYRVSFRTYNEFEPILVELRGDGGETGWGEVFIPGGSTVETGATGWEFCCGMAERIVGLEVAEAAAMVDAVAGVMPFGASALHMALAWISRHPALEVDERQAVPLLAPVGSKTRAEIANEVERLLAAGYRTLKVKVGWEVKDDLERLALVQEAIAGRATITMDANRGYTEAEGCEFASSLDPAGIALFEQPCEADQWKENAAVARVSRVPIMLDESIRTPADIDHASSIPGVKMVKLKLKRAGGLDRGITAMRRARELGLDICLGDGVGTELAAWVEACASRPFLTRAGDMNGFLKPKVRLFQEPLPFEGGSIILDPAFKPEINREMVERHTTATVSARRTQVAAGAH